MAASSVEHSSAPRSSRYQRHASSACRLAAPRPCSFSVSWNGVAAAFRNCRIAWRGGADDPGRRSARQHRSRERQPRGGSGGRLRASRSRSPASTARSESRVCQPASSSGNSRWISGHQPSTVSGKSHPVPRQRDLNRRVAGDRRQVDPSRSHNPATAPWGPTPVIRLTPRSYRCPSCRTPTHAPPTRSDRSRSSTLRPALAKRPAAASPPIPPPTTTTSQRRAGVSPAGWSVAASDRAGAGRSDGATPAPPSGVVADSRLAARGSWLDFSASDLIPDPGWPAGSAFREIRSAGAGSSRGSACTRSADRSGSSQNRRRSAV